MRVICFAIVALTMVGCSEPPATSSSNVTSKTSSNMYPRLKALKQPAPVADRISYSYQQHGVTIQDPYNWIRDPEYPVVNDAAVLDYLNAENAYYHAFLDQHTKLVDTLFEEFKGRVDESETSVPYEKNGFVYRWEYRQGANYPTYLRRPIDGTEEVVLLDVPALAEGFEYFVVGEWVVSEDNRYLAYSVDTNGDEAYDIFIRDLQSGQLLQDKLVGTGGDVLFAANNQLLYPKLQNEKWRVESINLHTLGTDQGSDTALIREEDEGFFLSAELLSSGEWIAFSSGRGEVTELHVVPASQPDASLTKLVSREQGFKADVDHANGYFYLLANDTHVNGRLVRVKQTEADYANWETLIAGSDNTYLRYLQTFKDFLALQMRDNGLDQIRILPNAGAAYDIDFPEPVYTANLGTNPQFEQSHLRLSYESMITPDTVYDFDLGSQALTIRKQQNIPSGYNSAHYVTERVMVPVRDGVQVPVSLVYKKGVEKDGTAPMWLYGYGAYGAGMSPSFSTTRLSMLDRGFVYALAHIRGGDEMGYQWYLDGKLDKRQNTFNDFVDVAKWLASKGYTSEGNISISGRSAGGELMGAVTIQAPELWRSVTLGVPFVDVMNTMLDASLPLTPPEWEEWGNPLESERDFHTMLAYSPYDNIEKRAYPPMMVTGGLNDPRVTYWEPAKWTAKMRALKTDANLLIMRMNMGAGHFANSGRYGRLRDYAEEFAFMLVAHDIHQ